MEQVISFSLYFPLVADIEVIDHVKNEWVPVNNIDKTITLQVLYEANIDFGRYEHVDPEAEEDMLLKEEWYFDTLSEADLIYGIEDKLYDFDNDGERVKIFINELNPAQVASYVDFEDTFYDDFKRSLYKVVDAFSSDMCSQVNGLINNYYLKDEEGNISQGNVYWKELSR